MNPAMGQLGFHIEMKLADGRVLVTSIAERRLLARIVLDKGRDCGLLAMRAPDTHLHVVAACTRRVAGVFVSRVRRSLRQRLDLPVRFAAPYIEPIRDQRHLYNASRYVFRQDEHHGVDVDPWAEASNLPDLLGLRQVGVYTVANVSRLLPRIRPEELVRHLGVTLEQLDDCATMAGAVDSLAAAAAAAVALPDVGGQAPVAIAARRAAVALVGDCLPTRRIAALLGTTDRAVRRLRSRPADPALVTAVARQLRLRSAVTVR